MNDSISDRDTDGTSPAPRASRLPGAAFGRAALDDGASARSRAARSMLQTVPIMLVGSMALSLGMTGPIASVAHDQQPAKKPHTAPRPVALPPTESAPAPQAEAATVDVAASTTTVLAPSTYTVVAGDTVASIAASFGLSTASVLALNGLSWKSTIFPGQTLSLAASTPAPAASAPRAAAAGSYTIARGDTLSSIAGAHGVGTAALLAANGLSWSSIIYPGQVLSLPGGATTASAVSTPAPATTPSGSGHVIRSGETIASIAKQTGTTVQALLAANGLSMTSTIYAGRTLVVPGASAPSAAPAVAPASTSAAPLATGTSLSAEQQENARVIIRVGRELGVGDQAIVVALAAAAQESSLRNIHHGDRDSLGLFQQRPSTGWGTPAELTDAAHATRLFFGGRTNPNVGKTRGLLDVAGWASMSLTDAAQAVQLSAHPTAYAKWEGPARTWLSTLG
ncbi:LysM peptidoglycan-binding domain-containing protein [Frigoribacterium faeni]|uniref:LysM peptidoglycan-binding domain-containing protein n=1 Tax=Frigoribacterium faeni TaxID=145483 RepID=UPI001FBAC848|nr:LysM peptidoglycan-binding domain-containing protein [Frigoribacterium faeni]NIJ03505.1 LysM repeat protein [Frigoribacterium faeni]